MPVEARLDLLASVGCQAAAFTSEVCGWDGVSVGTVTGSFPAPSIPAARALVTGTTVRIWAETPLIMVWMVVGTVITVKVVGVWSGFPVLPFEPPVWVVDTCLSVVLPSWLLCSDVGTALVAVRMVVPTSMLVVIGRFPTGQLTAPGGHLVSVYVVVESA